MQATTAAVRPGIATALPSYIMASVEPNALNSVVEQLKKEQGIRLIAPTTGRHNLIVQLNSNDNTKVYAFANRLHSMRGVRRTRTLIAFEGYLSEKQLAPSEALALVCLNVQEQPGKVLESLRQTPIHSAYVVPGEFDIIATVSGRDHNEVLERVARIAEIPGVDGGETVFAYKPIWA
jgi:DNA-binding Lrp family transcriptional regulator